MLWLLTALFLQADEGAPLRRFALTVGANHGGPANATLRYAESDAATVAAVLTELGGIAASDSVTLLQPSREVLKQALTGLRDTVTQAKQQARRTELVVYYSGHSDDSGLLLGTSSLPYGELRQSLDAIDADVRVVILDSCSSGAMTRQKGGQSRPPFLLDLQTTVSGHAFLTSSSADEASQESDRLGGSYFTHAFVSGLRGAADSTPDGRVTLSEAYQFAYDETLARTQTSLRGAQHPSFEMQLSGSGDVVLTDLRATSTTLRVEESLQGRLFVRDAQERLVAELYKQGDKALALALPPGAYHVMWDGPEGKYEARLQLQAQRPTTLTKQAMTPVTLDPTRSRGPEQGLVEVYPSLQFGLFPGLLYNTQGTLLEIGLLWANAQKVRGVSLGTLFSYHGEGLQGVQLSFGYSGTSRANGWQAALGVTAAKEAHGLQSALGLNYAETVRGAQVAAMNITGPIIGLQVGILNIAGDVTGGQLGIINIADKVRGTQVGILNISDSFLQGIPLGPLNFVRDGQFLADIYTSDTHRLNAGLRLGSRNVYTLFSVSQEKLEGDEGRVPISLGFGARFGETLYWSTDASVGAVLYGSISHTGARAYRIKPRTAAAMAILRTFIGIELYRGWGAYAGVSLQGYYWDDEPLANDHIVRFRAYEHVGRAQRTTAGSISVGVPDYRVEVGPGIFAGIQL